MRIHKLNSSIVTVIIGLTFITFGFQNCTKARFVIDEAAKQKALGDSSVFGNTPGDDGQIAGTRPGDDGSIPGSLPGDDGSIPGSLPGNDNSVPGSKNPGNDNSVPGSKNPGNDNSVPGSKNPGNDNSVPGHKNPGNDNSVPGSKNPGNDNSIPGSKNPGNDNSIPGSKNPGNDNSIPGSKNPGNDNSIPGSKNPGNDNSVPGSTNPGNDNSVPGSTNPGNDNSVPANNGSAITVVPQAVCGPSVDQGQASLPTASKVVAVLFKSDNFVVGATVIQAWDAEPDVTNIRAQLASLKPLQLKLSKNLAAGTYSVVMFDASKVKAPYYYDWTGGSNAIAPLLDSVAHLIDHSSTFTVDSSGRQKSSQSMNILVGHFGDSACKSASTIDPLLIQLKTSVPQSIALTAPEDGVMFDLVGHRLNHKPVQTAWFANSKTENYFLVLPNKDGKVLGIDQLFGDATLGPDGKYAKQGFAALAKYDESGDKIISEDDEVFSKLRLWRDDNLDGIAQESELYTLEEKGVVAIDLRFDRRFQETDQYGNVTKYKSIVVMKDGQYGMVYDLYLKYINK
jgi:hypothetical protein